MNPEYLKMLQGLPLFAEFTDAELEGTLDLLDTEHFAPGEAVVRQDEKGDCMFVLVDGSARDITRGGDEGKAERRLSVLYDQGPGDDELNNSLFIGSDIADLSGEDVGTLGF